MAASEVFHTNCRRLVSVLCRSGVSEQAVRTITTKTRKNATRQTGHARPGGAQREVGQQSLSRAPITHYQRKKLITLPLLPLPYLPCPLMRHTETHQGGSPPRSHWTHSHQQRCVGSVIVSHFLSFFLM
jgi:hypothetical protein